MKKITHIFVFLVASLLVSNIEAQNLANSSTTVIETKTKKELNKKSSDFDVRIKLEDRYGNEVPAATLPGYYAYNVETNTYYYADDRREVDLFTNLPAGTYRFDAYDGYFDGASSTIVTLSNNSIVNDEIIVTLSYWSE
ncbi:hypothetical protein [Tenacibaculum jejuense]|uniref:Carboxypeptidase regulatory-like domain-containing protein n=1 Tax=Tenacibaculum jejuense TaxID=584609 RepID=A0A238UC38_9FLAO|nr:hypothetical protein [Tenacibaculum jejuense]SNR15980.1 Protein of unknown function precursor [Tenacibaculum jejuense]